jgi:hypothetical protein
MNGRVSAPTKKKGFREKKKDVDHIKGGYRDKKNHFQNYNTSSPSPQIANINFNSPFPVKKPEAQSNQFNHQTENHTKEKLSKSPITATPHYRYP